MLQSVTNAYSSSALWRLQALTLVAAIVQVLVRNSADKQIPDRVGSLPLDVVCAANTNCSQDLVRRLSALLQWSIGFFYSTERLKMFRKLARHSTITFARVSTQSFAPRHSTGIQKCAVRKHTVCKRIPYCSSSDGNGRDRRVSIAEER